MKECGHIPSMPREDSRCRCHLLARCLFAAALLAPALLGAQALSPPPAATLSPPPKNRFENDAKRSATHVPQADGTLNLITLMVNDSLQHLTRQPEPDGNFLRFVHDAAERLIEVEDSLGHRVHYELDGAGNRRAERFVDAGGQLRRRLERVFDVLNRLEIRTGRE